MNILPFDRQVSAVAALTEGVSIRATERLTGVHRDTIMRLGVRVGEGCAALHDRMMVNLQVAEIELDEIWAFVGKKQKRVTPAEGDKGYQYLFTAMDGIGKAILSYRVGKRNGENTRAFLADLRERVINRPSISSDAFKPYPEAVELAFGADVDYGQIHKSYSTDMDVRVAARRYSPGQVVAVRQRRVQGDPERICTSHMERGNLTIRMQMRRFTRLTNGFSKKLRNHRAAISLFVAHYNLCRVHETIRMTPAMMLGVADHIWGIDELIAATTDAGVPDPAGRRVGRLRVIDGGVS